MSLSQPFTNFKFHVKDQDSRDTRIRLGSTLHFSRQAMLQLTTMCCTTSPMITLQRALRSYGQRLLSGSGYSSAKRKPSTLNSAHTRSTAMAACHMFEEPTKRYKVQRRAWVADQASYVQIEVSTGMCVCGQSLRWYVYPS